MRGRTSRPRALRDSSQNKHPGIIESGPVGPGPTRCPSHRVADPWGYRRVRYKKGPEAMLPTLNVWSRGQDLNLRPSGYEPDELPDCSTPQYVRRVKRKKELYADFPCPSRMWRNLHNLNQARLRRGYRRGPGEDPDVIPESAGRHPDDDLGAIPVGPHSCGARTPLSGPLRPTPAAG